MLRPSVLSCLMIMYELYSYKSYAAWVYFKDFLVFEKSIDTSRTPLLKLESSAAVMENLEL